MYETVMKLVTTDEDQAAVTNALNDLQQKLLQMKMDNVTPKRPPGARDGPASLPEVQKSPNKKRRKPFGSPSKSNNH